MSKLPVERRKLLLLGGVTLKTAVELRDYRLIELDNLHLPSPLAWEVLARLVHESLAN